MPKQCHYTLTSESWCRRRRHRRVGPVDQADWGILPHMLVHAWLDLCDRHFVAVFTARRKALPTLAGSRWRRACKRFSNAVLRGRRPLTWVRCAFLRSHSRLGTRAAFVRNPSGWKRYAMFVLGGVVVGIAAVFVALAADRASRIFEWVMAQEPVAALCMTPLGFALSSWLATRFFPNSGGSGIPQAIAARQLSGWAARHRLVSLRIAVGKCCCCCLDSCAAPRSDVRDRPCRSGRRSCSPWAGSRHAGNLV